MENFLCKVKYEKILENGFVKNVTEQYLVVEDDYSTFSSAEEKFIHEISPYMSGDFEVKAVAKQNYSEIFTSNEDSADKFYKVKIDIITLDEKTGKEKKQKFNYLVQASDILDAHNKFNESMKGTMCDYVITHISETPIMDIFK